MKPITGEPAPSISVFVYAHISYVHVQRIDWLTKHQQGNISRLHTDARPPSVNDYEMAVVVRANGKVK